MQKTRAGHGPSGVISQNKKYKMIICPREMNDTEVNVKASRLANVIYKHLLFLIPTDIDPITFSTIPRL